MLQHILWSADAISEISDQSHSLHILVICPGILLVFSGAEIWPHRWLFPNFEKKSQPSLFVFFVFFWRLGFSFSHHTHKLHSDNLLYYWILFLLQFLIANVRLSAKANDQKWHDCALYQISQFRGLPLIFPIWKALGSLPKVAKTIPVGLFNMLSQQIHSNTCRPDIDFEISVVLS